MLLIFSKGRGASAVTPHGQRGFQGGPQGGLPGSGSLHLCCGSVVQVRMRKLPRRQREGRGGRGEGRGGGGGGMPGAFMGVLRRRQGPQYAGGCMYPGGQDERRRGGGWRCTTAKRTGSSPATRGEGGGGDHVFGKGIGSGLDGDGGANKEGRRGEEGRGREKKREDHRGSGRRCKRYSANSLFIRSCLKRIERRAL